MHWFINLFIRRSISRTSFSLSFSFFNRSQDCFALAFVSLSHTHTRNHSNTIASTNTSTPLFIHNKRAFGIITCANGGQSTIDNYDVSLAVVVAVVIVAVAVIVIGYLDNMQLTDPNLQCSWQPATRLYRSHVIFAHNYCDTARQYCCCFSRCSCCCCCCCGCMLHVAK